jgi:hypothetical protein
MSKGSRVSRAHLTKLQERARRVTACGVLVGASITASAHAGATTLNVVTLAPEGPDAPLPLGTAFHLAVSAQTDAKTAYAVFVRTHWPFLGFGEGLDACPARDAPKVTNLRPGRRGAREVWGSQVEDEPALVVQSGDVGTDEKFKLLVPSSSLFHEGASYCLYVYQHTKTTERQEVAIQRLLVQYGHEASFCRGNHCDVRALSCPNPQYLACLSSDPPAAAGQPVVLSPVSKLVQAVERELVTVDAKQTRDVVTGLRGKLLDAVAKLSEAPAVIQNNLKHIGEHHLRPAPDGAAYPVASDRGAALAELLARAAKIRRTDEGYRDEEDWGIQSVALSSDFKRFSVHAVEPNPAPRTQAKSRTTTIEVEAGTLSIPSTSLSLEALWRYSMGELEVDGSYRRADDLWATVGTFVRAPAPAGAGLTYGSEEIERAQTVQQKFESLHVGLGAIAQATKPQNASLSDVSLLLHNLQDLVPSRSSGPAPEYTAAVALDQYVQAIKVWNDAPKVIREQVLEKVVAGPSATLSQRGKLTQESWFDSYFTTFVGRAYVNTPTANISEWYLGVQVFGWANPIDEPMWSNGADDFRRFFGLELGIIPQGSFGPGDRFSGFAGGSTPALLFALAAQPLPYVTISGGGVRLHEKQSRIEGEASTAHTRWFVGLSLQANVPGIVRRIVTDSGAIGTVEGAPR